MSRNISQWMPIYWGDYHADTGHLCASEHGAYMLLIGHYWTTGKPLPNDDALLARISRMTPKEWKKHKETVISFFVLHENTYTHKRIDAEIKKQAEQYEKRKNAADKKWEVHRRLQMQSTCNADAMQMQLEPEPEPDNKSKDLLINPPNPPLPENQNRDGEKPHAKSSRKRTATHISDEFKPDFPELSLADSLGIDAIAELPKFIDYWKSRGEARADWNASFRTWLRNAAKYRAEDESKRISQRQGTGGIVEAGLRVAARYNN